MTDFKVSKLFGFLQYRNMETSNVLSHHSQESNHVMKDIAQKTKMETVSMRVITLVTLFFLPITFISVSLTRDASLKSHYLLIYRAATASIQKASFTAIADQVIFFKTIMSTDIIQFRRVDGKKVFQASALEFLLAVGGPMIAITFGAWWMVYWCITRPDRKKDLDEGQMV
jgi:hypothetical protein